MSVSYAITLYNKSRHIAGVLEAALAEHQQTGGEILVYDDASTDDSAAIAAGIAARAPIRLIRGERNRGVFAATTALVNEASQPYLRLIDGDDRVTRGSTGHLIDVLRRHDAGLVHGAYAVLGTSNETKDFAQARIVVEPHPLRDLLKSIPYNLSATLMPTGAAKAAMPLPAELRISQDLCLALRLAKRHRFAATDALVAFVPDEGDNRLSRRLAAMYRDSCLILAMELADAAPADAAYAVRRNAARARKYFRREAPGRLAAADKFFLTRCAAATPLAPVPRQCERLRRIAALYARDEGRVLQ